MSAIGGTHPCPGPWCQRQVPEAQVSCRQHWFTVSKETRARVWAAYQGHRGSAEHLEAIAQAITEMNQ